MTTEDHSKPALVAIHGYARLRLETVGPCPGRPLGLSRGGGSEGEADEDDPGGEWRAGPGRPPAATPVSVSRPVSGLTKDLGSGLLRIAFPCKAQWLR